MATLSAAVKLSRSRQEVGRLQNEVQALKGDDRIPELIGNSPAMQKVKETIYKLSDTDANLLILGENGTGKDLAARMLRFFSPRREQVFIPIDLGSIPEQLFFHSNHKGAGHCARPPFFYAETGRNYDKGTNRLGHRPPDGGAGRAEPRCDGLYPGSGGRPGPPAGDRAGGRPLPV